MRSPRGRLVFMALAALALGGCDVLVGVTDVSFFDASNDAGDATSEDAPVTDTATQDAPTDSSADAPDSAADSGGADAVQERKDAPPG
jgi:hypothetical protein